MNVMYWNCTAPGAGGSFSAEKVDAIGQRIAALQPDIICLDEMSALITGALTADRRLNSMKTSEGAPANLSETYAAVNVNVNPGAHLNTAIFVRKTLLPAVVKVAIGLPQAKWDSDNTKRDLVRAQYMDSQTHRIVSIWFLHANASQRNGAKAASFAAQDVTAANNDIFIGDFNVNAPDLHLYPKAVQTKPALDGYTYSQWAKSAYSNGATQIGSTVDAKPGGLIDFAIANAAGTVKVTPLNSLAGLTHMTDLARDYRKDTLEYIQRTFDHFPVLFQVTCA